MSNGNQLAEELASELVTLRRYRLSDVPALKGAIEASFEQLRQFMPWAHTPPTDASVTEFVHPAALRFGGDADANYVITLTEDGTVVGSCGLMPRAGPRALEIGYWVDSRYTKRGIATTAATLLTDAAFGLDDIDRVEIHCDEANGASAAVAKKSGFRLDRVVPNTIEALADTGRAMIWVIGRDEWKIQLTRR
jgi:RimJ/RimL family protein N-acetyltransferase